MLATWDALVEMWSDGALWPDFTASSQRVLIGYSISLLVGVSIGLLIGSFRSVDAFLEPQVGFLRYIPATALTPLLLIWLGIDEAPKITLIVVGTVFYNVLMVADVARAVPDALINAAYTLGARRGPSCAGSSSRTRGPAWSTWPASTSPPGGSCSSSPSCSPPTRASPSASSGRSGSGASTGCSPCC